MIVTFQQCKVWRRKSGRCYICGKRTTRSKTFMQTVNPWNVVAGSDGLPRPKTVPEIYQELNRHADAWCAEDLTCVACDRELEEEWEA